MTTPMMISPAEADALLRDRMPAYGAIERPIAEAHGHILRAPICADRDLPPFDRVTMDGIAIAYAAWQNGQRRFRIEATASAGRPAPALTQADDGCVQVMTGAICPAGADTIVPYEECVIEGDWATIDEEARLAPLNYLHSQGSDRRAGDEILPVGLRLKSPHLSIAAAVGHAQLQLTAMPSVAVISTGDELRDVTDSVEPYQIRSANDHGIRAALLGSGYAEVTCFRVRDDLEETRQLLERALAEFDVLVLTGGVSMGKRDFVPAALAALQVEPVFHKIRQKPGKPMWFGVSPKGQPVFALPGNTVSTLVCLHRYVLQALAVACGQTPATPITIPLRRALRFPPPLTGFIPVRLDWTAEGRVYAEPMETNTSGDFSSLAASDGFIELPEGDDVFAAGFAATYIPWA